MANVIINTRGSIAEEVIEAGIVITCNENMDMVISESDLERLRTEFPAAYEDIYIVEQ